MEAVFIKRQEIINGIQFILQVLGSLVLSYLIPLINIFIICCVESEINNKYIEMNAINILLATNACFLAGVSSNYKINDKYNDIASFLKTLGLVVSTVAFAISTYELQNGVFAIHTSIYYVVAFLTTGIGVIMTFFSIIETSAFHKRYELGEVERAKKIIESSNQQNQYMINGDSFMV